MKQRFELSDRLAFVATLLFAGVLAMYLQTYHFEFINLDDHDYTLTCPFVCGGFSWTNLWTALTTFTYGGIWMPLTSLTYMLEISWFGRDPGVMHLTSGILHACNAVLLFVLLRELLKAVGGRKDDPGIKIVEEGGTRETDHSLIAAAIAAAFWAVHPLRAESAAWVAGRKDVLFLFFELLALICWVKHILVREGRTRSAEANLYYGLAIVCFLLACMGKPAAMSFPILAVLLEFLITRKICGWLYILPGLLGLTCAWLANYSQVVGGGVGPLADTTQFWRILNGIAAFGQYCRQSVWPFGLHMLYPPRFPDHPDHLLFGFFVCAIYGIILLVTFVRSLPLSRIPESVRPWITKIPFSSDTSCLVFVGLSWFLLSIAPMLGITASFGWHSHADRFTYLPSIGFSILIAGLIQKIREPRCFRYIVAGACVMTVLFGYLGYRQIGFWENDRVVFRRGYELSKPNPHVDAMLAMAYLPYPDKIEEALRILQESVQAKPNDKNLGALAFFLALKGREEQLVQAERLAHRAFELNPDEPMAIATMGLIALRRQDWTKAEHLLSESIQKSKNPQPPLFDWLGMARYNLKDFAGAVWAFEQGVIRLPNNSEMRQKLSTAMIALQEANEYLKTNEKPVIDKGEIFEDEAEE
jgi:protein O-mannosyl-transferase